MIELLVRMQHGHPACLGRAVELEQPGIGEHLHDPALGFHARRRRGNHQFFHPPEITCRVPEIQHHLVMGRHQGGETCSGLGQGPKAVPGVKTAAGKHAGRTAAMQKGGEKIEGIGVAHRHYQHCLVIPAEAQFNRRHQGEIADSLMSADCAFRVSGRS